MANIEIVDSPIIDVRLSTATISGTVKDGGLNYVARVVLLFSEKLQEIADKTVSNATTGAFALSANGGANDRFTVIVLGISGENDAVMGDITGILS